MDRRRPRPRFDSSKLIHWLPWSKLIVDSVVELLAIVLEKFNERPVLLNCVITHLPVFAPARCPGDPDADMLAV
jgi:hypothetical protein